MLSRYMIKSIYLMYMFILVATQTNYTIDKTNWESSHFNILFVLERARDKRKIYPFLYNIENKIVCTVF